MEKMVLFVNHTMTTFIRKFDKKETEKNKDFTARFVFSIKNLEQLQ